MRGRWTSHPKYGKHFEVFSYTNRKPKLSRGVDRGRAGEGAQPGLDPRRAVQVRCPMHRGPAGAGNLNLLLQEALTPFREGQPERRYGGRVFRTGDKGFRGDGAAPVADH
jgi:ATP-dependent exoDNAse (exonuclease V) alpha subunit